MMDRLIAVLDRWHNDAEHRSRVERSIIARARKVAINHALCPETVMARHANGTLANLMNLGPQGQRFLVVAALRCLPPQSAAAD
jgi:hypothetical protein